jgi:CBS domain-containing protein
VQAREVMTRDVVTVGPETSAHYAAEVLADHGFAALPVVDDDGRLLGIVAEADILRNRVPPDPRLHLRRAAGSDVPPPPSLVRGVMTSPVRSVEAAADVSDVARLFVEERLRSAPVVDAGRLVGIVSRRDLLRTLVRSDEQLRTDLLGLVAAYTGEPDSWDVTVAEGVATVRRTRGRPEGPPGSEEAAVRALAATVTGIVGVRVAPSAAPAGDQG